MVRRFLQQRLVFFGTVITVPCAKMKLVAWFPAFLALSAIVRFQASFACLTCPSNDWDLFDDGNCYQHVPDLVKWKEAREECQKLSTNETDAELASIHSEEVNAFVHELYWDGSEGSPPVGSY